MGGHSRGPPGVRFSFVDGEDLLGAPESKGTEGTSNVFSHPGKGVNQTGAGVL